MLKFQAFAAYAEAVGIQPIDMKVLVTAGSFSNFVQIKESDRLVQRRIDLPLPLAPAVKIDSVGEGSGCTILQVNICSMKNVCFKSDFASSIIFCVLSYSSCKSRPFATTFTDHHRAVPSRWMFLTTNCRRDLAAEFVTLKSVPVTILQHPRHTRPTWSYWNYISLPATRQISKLSRHL